MSKPYFSGACSIDLGESVVITGGIYNTNVTEYTEVGHMKELPQLITGRFRHGCAAYVDNDSNIVTINLFNNCDII